MPDYVVRYAPELYEGNTEMMALYEAQKNLFLELIEARKQLFGNLYVSSANLDGVKKYEETYEIVPDNSLSVEQRRSVILNKLVFRPPFTRNRIKEILDTYYGEGNYAFVIYPDIFTVLIDPDILDKGVYDYLSNLFREIIPANMTLLFGFPYMYIYLRRNYTYGLLASLTYGELSQYSGTMNLDSHVL